MKYFLAYLFLEIAVSIPAFSYFGVLGTFGEILASALLGVFLLQNSSYTLSESFNALRQNQISLSAFKSISLLTIIGAFMLIVPGVLTDILGILFQFSIVGTYIAKLNKNNTTSHANNRDYEGDIIDVEVIESIEDDKKH